MTRVNYKLFGVLLLLGFIPTVYLTIRIFLLGNLPTDYGLNIASQLSWISLIYEIILEALILPLFFFLGKFITDKKKFTNTLKSILIIGFLLNLCVGALLFLFAKPLIIFMAQDVNLLKETVEFVRIEAISNLFGILVRILLVSLILLDKRKNLLIILLFQMICTIFFDVLLLSDLQISLKIGAVGIAYSNLITNIILFFIGVVLLKKEGISILSKEKLHLNFNKSNVKISVLSGIETLIRNVAFIIMVARMVNMVGEQGTFWVANNFIWGWLLVPIIQLGEVIKKDFSVSDDISKAKIIGYFKLTSIIIAIWILTIPLWDVFFENVLNIQNYSDVFYIVIISLGFYVLFAYNNVCDSIFYAKGRTDLMLYQSLLVNIIYYGVLFVLFIHGIFAPTLQLIAIMFGTGIAIDSIATFVIFFIYAKKINRKMQ